jgi:hypothetical protein
MAIRITLNKADLCHPGDSSRAKYLPIVKSILELAETANVIQKTEWKDPFHFFNSEFKENNDEKKTADTTHRRHADHPGQRFTGGYR